MLHFLDPCEAASSRMLQSLPVVSSQPSTSKSAESTSNLNIDEDLVMGSRNLSSTLQKLYHLEKKLYNEVKVYIII